MRPISIVAAVVLTTVGLGIVAARAWAGAGTSAQSSPPAVAPPAEIVQSPRALAASSPINSDDIRPPVVTPRMRRYSRTCYALYFVNTGAALAAYAWLLRSRRSSRIRSVATRLTLKLLRRRRGSRKDAHPVGRMRQRLAIYGARQVLPLAINLTLVTGTLILVYAPLTFYSGYWLDHEYGLSSQSLSGWLADALKARLVDMAITFLGLLLLFAVIRRSPRRWSLWFWAASIPLMAFGIFLAPLVLDPLFNKFTPMAPGPQRSQIEALAAKAGIPNAPIFVVDKSRQTNMTNAYVTGLGSSARIVIWDTTLKRMPPDQVDAIVAHETGHYVLGHIARGFCESVVALLILLPLAQWFLETLVRRWGKAWGVRGLTDPAIIPALYLTMSLFSFLTAPAENALSRQIEHEADAYGLRLCGDGPAMARAFVSLSEQNLSDPDPPAFIRFWLFSHPPLAERIDFVLGRKSQPSGE